MHQLLLFGKNGWLRTDQPISRPMKRNFKKEISKKLLQSTDQKFPPHSLFSSIFRFLSSFTGFKEERIFDWESILPQKAALTERRKSRQSQSKDK